jgi:very-short-patch-repair endonuclease
MMSRLRYPGKRPRTRQRHYKLSRCERVNATTTPEELKLCRALRAVGGRWLLHVEIGGYYPDLFNPARNLIVEVDGGYHKTTRAQWRDLLRTEALESWGYRVVRVANEDLSDDRIDATVRRIHRLAAQAWRRAPAGRRRAVSVTGDEIARRLEERKTRPRLPWEMP